MTELRHRVLGTVGAKEEPKPEMKKDDLQSLIELGCIKEEVNIDGTIFVLRSLGATESLELSKKLNEKDGDVFDINVRLLAMAISSVNGKPLEALHPDPKDPFSAKMEIISLLQTSVISKLLESYQKLIERSNGQFTMDQVKK